MDLETILRKKSLTRERSRLNKRLEILEIDKGLFESDLRLASDPLLKDHPRIQESIERFKEKIKEKEIEIKPIKERIDTINNFDLKELIGR